MWKRITSTFSTVTGKFVSNMMGWDKLLLDRVEMKLSPVAPIKKRKQIRRKKKITLTKFQPLSMEEIIEQLRVLVDEYEIYEEPWPFHNGLKPLTVTQKKLEAILFSDSFRMLVESTLPVSFGASPLTRDAPTICYEEFLPLLNSLNHHMTKQKWGGHISCNEVITIRGIRRRRITFTGSTARYMYLLNLTDIIALACPNKTPFQEDYRTEPEDDPAAQSTIENSASEEGQVASMTDKGPATEQEIVIILPFPSEPPPLESPKTIHTEHGVLHTFAPRGISEKPMPDVRDFRSYYTVDAYGEIPE
jgi:hypothetical protein